MLARGRWSQGFTLIELMVTVAIVALVAALAYPAYTDSVIKGKRAEGRTALIGLMQQEERYMTQSNTYFKDGSGVSYTAKSERGSYNLSTGQCTEGTIRECVRVTATPNFSDSLAGALWMESSGSKGCGGSKPEVCWK